MAGITFSEIVFADDTKVPMKPGDILVLTGPNNGGKSNALRNLHSRVIRLSDPRPRESIKSTSTHRSGNFEELLTHLEKFGPVVTTERGTLELRSRLGSFVLRPEIWGADFPDQWTNFFTTLLTARERFNIVSGSQNVSFVEAFTPLQKMPFNEQKERQISEVINRGFGVEIYTHIDGNSLSLKTGKRSDFPTRQDWRTPEEQRKARKLRNLTDEGDGIQSFTAVLMAALVDPKSITLVDEAEAFLHPPQARRLAQALVKEMPTNGQLIVATHNYDFVRGLVASGGERVHVVRIRRAPETITKHLPNDKLKELWSDPLLFTTDLISALFHDVAVLCEGETDVRFYRAMVDALESSCADPLPDIRFFSCGSKSKIDKVANSLRAIGVPTIAITDCDVLNNKNLVERILSSLSHTVPNFNANYTTLSQAVNTGFARKSAAAIAAELQVHVEAIDRLAPEQRLLPLQNNRKNAINCVLEEANQWTAMKRKGRDAIVPLGANVVAAFDHIRDESIKGGLLMSKHGELESFWPEGPQNDKPQWLNEVLQMNLAEDIRLENARAFAREIITAAIELKHKTV